MFCGLAKPEFVANAIGTISVMVKQSNPKTFPFWIYSFILSVQWLNLVYKNILYSSGWWYNDVLHNSYAANNAMVDIYFKITIMITIVRPIRQKKRSK